MFGSKEQKIARLVKRGRWGKIGKMLEKGDSETRVAVTAELGNTKDESAYNYLILLLKDNDEQVQLQAVKSLGNLEMERAKVHLQNLISSVPKEKTSLIDAIKESISKINQASGLNI